MFYQYNRQWTIAIKHRKRIAEWEILIEKNNKIDIFAIRALYMILIGHVPRTPGDNIICPIEGFRWHQKWNGETLYECTFLIGRAPKDVCWNCLNPIQMFCTNHPCDVPNKSDTYTQTEGTPSNKP